MDKLKEYEGDPVTPKRRGMILPFHPKGSQGQQQA